MSTTRSRSTSRCLEAAGLVRKDRRGRETIVVPEPAALAAGRTALDRLEDLWRERLERFGRVLADLKQEDHR